MKAVILNENKTLTIGETPLPQNKSGEALVKINYTGICGSDLFHLSGDNPRAVLPLIAGHEIAGVIQEPPAGGGRWNEGDRVTVFPALSCGRCEACRSGNPQMHRPLRMIGVQAAGGFAEYCRVPEENLIPIPAGLPGAAAALAEPMAVALHGVRLAKPEAGDRALVIGAGPIGLMAAALLKKAGCSRVFLSERSAERIKFARNMGFECIDLKENQPEEYILEATRGRGVEVILECVGHPSTIPQIIGAGALHSRAVIIGAFHGEGAMVDFFSMSKKEQTLTVSWQYTRDDFRRGLDLLADEGFPSRTLVTHILPPEKIQEGMALMRSGEAMKVLIGFDQE